MEGCESLDLLWYNGDMRSKILIISAIVITPIYLYLYSFIGDPFQPWLVIACHRPYGTVTLTTSNETSEFLQSSELRKDPETLELVLQQEASKQWRGDIGWDELSQYLLSEGWEGNNEYSTTKFSFKKRPSGFLPFQRISAEIRYTYSFNPVDYESLEAVSSGFYPGNESKRFSDLAIEGKKWLENNRHKATSRELMFQYEGGFSFEGEQLYKKTIRGLNKRYGSTLPEKPAFSRNSHDCP